MELWWKPKNLSGGAGVSVGEEAVGLDERRELHPFVGGVLQRSDAILDYAHLLQSSQLSPALFGIIGD